MVFVTEVSNQPGFVALRCTENGRPSRLRAFRFMTEVFWFLILRPDGRGSGFYWSCLGLGWGEFRVLGWTVRIGSPAFRRRWWIGDRDHRIAKR